MRTRRRHVARAAAVSALAVTAVLVAILGTRPSLTEQVVQTPLVGRPAPQLSGNELTGDRPISLTAYAGRWVLVNFFASWCTECQSEAPQIERFVFSRPDGVRPAVIGVLYGDTRSDGVQFQRAEGASWPAVYDPNGTIASAWGVGSLPRSYLVAPDGRIVACVLGGITAGGLDRLLEKQAAAKVRAA